MNYPYSTAPTSIHKILSKFQNIGQPSKVNKTWMNSIGFTVDSEHRIIPILKFLNFIDKSGTPTDRWAKFRSHKTGPGELAKAIMESYSELFDIYPNANKEEKSELMHFFTTRTTAGSLVINHTISTFKNLVSFAKFDDEEKSDYAEDSKEEIIQPKTQLFSEVSENSNEESNLLSKKFQNLKSGVTINLNIQLTVPETTDEKVYDKFFESMKKHLLS